jgi:ketopantoate hydroxymethyltransferase
MGKGRETTTEVPVASLAEAWQAVRASFEQFCLTAGMTALSEMMAEDAARSAVHGMATRMAVAVTAGAGPRAKSAFTVARCRWSDRGCVRETVRRWRCRAGKRRRRRTCWVVGQ